MSDHDAFALGQSDLNRFLFAVICVEGNGMPLSVISALARQGLDPWQEAGRLSRLPKSAATEGLARIITAMSTDKWIIADAMAIAIRLVALLPGQAVIPAIAAIPVAFDWRWMVVAAIAIVPVAASIIYLAIR